MHFLLSFVCRPALFAAAVPFRYGGIASLRCCHGLFRTVGLRLGLKNLGYNEKQVFEIKRPDRCGLPSPNLSTAYVFATNRDFFAYPNNYNYYVQYYKDTFQHGGISMEEMLVPIITMQPK